LLGQVNWQVDSSGNVSNVSFVGNSLALKVNYFNDTPVENGDSTTPYTSIYVTNPTGPAGYTSGMSAGSRPTVGGSTVCDGVSPTFKGYTYWDFYCLGAAPGCNSDVTVTAHWAGGAPHAAGVVVNAVVGGYLVQLQCDANGCNSGTVPSAKLNLTGTSPWSVDAGLESGSWTICGVSGSRYQTTPSITSAPSTVACGGTVDIALASGCATTPTPSPSPSATVAPSPSVTPSPSVSPVPSPSATPLQFPTPPPNNGGTTVTNGGTTMSGITNQDIYNDVKQALDDAGTRDSEFAVADGGFGFGSDPGGENGSAGSSLQSAVDRFTNDLSGSGDGLMEKVDAIDSLSLPTSIGDKSSWAVSLPVLGDLTIDLSTFDGPVWAFRSLCLGVLVVGAWFAIVKIVRSGVA
jgi:hypothetical protein